MEEDKKIPKLLVNILKSKGLNDDHIALLEDAGISSKADFEFIGDPQTFMDITGLDEEVSQKVMEWAVGSKKQAQQEAKPEEQQSQQQIIVEGSDVVKCVHCGTRQPKDYKTGDLCLSCGNQAEPVLNCHWCLSSGPGKFCRECGAEFVGSSDFEIALYLKREGESKNAIVNMVKNMTAQEKENIWAKVRRSR
ncbi:hypothetical protein GCM10009122_35300 [Fulvivirga kasyanovii]|uniref:Zinc ribbon domain-containing protein n=1 Tax=Fulvivirga kasyanovii TaxID=396812 RepID=A0ABW9RUM7_9BACT|nr:hypothetical protein [Fulvivirga kasyanovii]MTI27591.1 hypothetical protein [Fulvivirga kasyanovii]